VLILLLNYLVLVKIFFFDRPFTINIISTAIANPSMDINNLIPSTGIYYQQWAVNATGPLSQVPAPIKISFNTLNYSSPDIDCEVEYIAAGGDLPSQLGVNAVLAACFPLSPFSRGEVKLYSGNPFQNLYIDPNYYGDSRDLDTAVRCMKTVHSLFFDPAMSNISVADVIVGDAWNLPEPILSIVLGQIAEGVLSSAKHFGGSCKMGNSDDNMAVVDPTNLQVIGIDGLRIVDSSIHPFPIRSKSMAPIFAMAERAADLIKKDYQRKRNSYPNVSVTAVCNGYWQLVNNYPDDYVVIDWTAPSQSTSGTWSANPNTTTFFMTPTNSNISVTILGVAIVTNLAYSSTSC